MLFQEVNIQVEGSKVETTNIGLALYLYTIGANCLKKRVEVANLVTTKCPAPLSGYQITVEILVFVNKLLWG